MLLIDWIIGKVNEKNNTINNEYDIIEKDDLLLITKTIKKSIRL